MEALCEDLFPTPAGAPEPDIIINITAISNVISKQSKLVNIINNKKIHTNFSFMETFPTVLVGKAELLKKYGIIW